MRKRIRAVVFDLYETLIHIRDDKKTFKRMLDELGGNTKDGYSHAWRTAFTRYFPSLEKLAITINPAHQADITAFKKEISDEVGRAECFAETLEVLAHLRRKKIALGIISDAMIPYHRPFFDLGLRRLFDEYIFSCEAGLIKPDPDIYLMMLEKLGLDPSEVLMVGDNPIADVAGPKSVGMSALLLDRNARSDSAETIRSLDGIYPFIH